MLHEPCNCDNELAVRITPMCGLNKVPAHHTNPWKVWRECVPTVKVNTLDALKMNR